ncbi:ABC transporter ATP-binding protein [Sphingomonas ginsenosidivorax]|uniref:ABC transporter ATP-binding protein n=1 Tax=Sphingomonas ginsenosidivorax TaxID=862135 RepID=A0A5C6UEH3_9SPHN|nr:ABC transporter ATP-binding protein [Sphingomonas ginsenosidivorax]TXC71152.1 ABC transporter ATP-binding protein [Sphingomonas ginsenosidivorax]
MVSIAAEGLSVSLSGTRVIDDLSVSLGSGALIGVVGPNGAGKSTLARALLGLLVPDAGRVTIDGDDVATLPSATIARRTAYLPQAYAVHWPLSVERLVGLGRLPHLGPFSRITQADQAAIDAAMHDTGTAHLADRTATELSGGERARVMLARALATGAPALIADEPLTSLDPGHQLEIMALLKDRARAGALVVVVLHDLGIAARFCDRLLLIDRGRLKADGPPQSVLTDAALAETYAITAWRGEVNGQPLLVPFDRIA